MNQPTTAFGFLWSQLWTPAHRELFRAWLGTAIRTAIVAAGAWLKATGKFPFITGPAIDKIAGYAPQLAGDLIIFGGLAWSALQKWKADRRQKTALAMPPDSTQTDLNVVMKETSPGLIPTGPIPSAATAAAIVDNAPKEAA